MAYKKDQGRFARMGAFWALFLLLAYGCLGGLTIQLRRWLGGVDAEPWLESLPLIGDIDLARVIALGILAVGGFLLYRWLNSPKAADMLIDTESELRKVTWPSASDTWVGTLAVLTTVFVLLLYLFGADLMLTYIMTSLMTRGQG